MAHIKKIIKYLSSLKLTLVLLSMLLVLIFISTMHQVDLGIYFTKKKYFQGFFVWYKLGNVISIPVFLSGFSIGLLLTINLLAAHWVRLKFSKNKMGIWLIHIGLLMLIIGSGLTQFLSVESQMVINEGEEKHYSESLRELELAVIVSENVKDKVVSFMPAKFKKGSVFKHEEFPFEIVVNRYLANASLFQLTEDNNKRITQGLGQKIRVEALDIFTRDDLRNMTVLEVEIFNEGKSLGTWLLSNALIQKQILTIDGKEYALQLREARFYNRFSLTLNEFKNERYHGTNIPKSYTSILQLKNDEINENRQVLTYMNHPLRYDGKTYYQASFSNEGKTTILQVVSNPGWLFPYVSSILMGLGLLIQFLFHFLKFLNTTFRRNKK